MNKLFVYGTLREPGVEATHCLYNYEMFDNGDWPYIKPIPEYVDSVDDSVDVYGCVINVSNKQLKELDKYERCDTGMFVRTAVDVYPVGDFNAESIKVFTYVAGNFLPQRIQSGDWFKRA